MARRKQGARAPALRRGAMAAHRGKTKCKGSFVPMNGIGTKDDSALGLCATLRWLFAAVRWWQEHSAFSGRRRKAPREM